MEKISYYLPYLYNSCRVVAFISLGRFMYKLGGALLDRHIKDESLFQTIHLSRHNRFSRKELEDISEVVQDEIAFAGELEGEEGFQQLSFTPKSFNDNQIRNKRR